MSVTLPPPIAAYFAADSAGAGVADCFAPTGAVKDEGRTHVGRAAIARWKAEASSQYDYVSEPVAVEENGEQVLVTSRVTGNFPGSPVDLRYRFVVAADGIVRLEIGA
ncbi:nuclear transport factor 2 family protein [Methylobrevis pamukkalensis]|uniref:SnoaL-like domain protein n=1 Tax=Methylobrevis pamukkalensis TaxID=1439726 RepID=A0A1E3H7H3_9HYPH|nr:nuclear transport factor 2 family protein [Methylobrevis pamukkalensis]ODN72105.1 SnoaL-like domain protein [Methylobrevis pamukkalensis]